MKFILNSLLFNLLAGLLLFSCQKDDPVTSENAHLSFSSDTVYFDTVLTSLGSITRQLKIYNVHDRPINISKLYLASGSSSFFRLNVDGTKGSTHSNILIPANDSIYVFTEVTIDPLNENNPLLVKDSIICITNGNQQDVKLIAYGQDIKLFRNELIKTQTWTSEKPYLILVGAALDSNEVLTIEAGTRIFMHNGASLEIRGRLEAKGSLDEPVIFSGSRFDERYENAAGQWGAIAFVNGSRENTLEYVNIRNAIAGIQVGLYYDETASQIELRNCVISNCSSVGIRGFGADIDAYNTIIADCGQLALLFQMGGNYNFYHCTINNISDYYSGTGLSGYRSGRVNPTLFFSNYFNWFGLNNDYQVEAVTYSGDIRVNFYNSIVYGVHDTEVDYDSISTAGLNYLFDHCLLKNLSDSLDYDNPDNFVKLILNEDPLFRNDSLTHGDYDFQLNAGSPAIDSGNAVSIQGILQLVNDFNGDSRMSDGMPDLGAFEFNE
jgi:hypothetical protein